MIKQNWTEAQKILKTEAERMEWSKLQTNAGCYMLDKLTTSMYGQQIKSTGSQKDLTLIIPSNLSWHCNCNHRVQKATSVFFQIKRINHESKSAISSTSEKRNALLVVFSQH